MPEGQSLSSSQRWVQTHDGWPIRHQQLSGDSQLFSTAYTEHESPNAALSVPQAAMTASNTAAARDSRGICMLRFMLVRC